MTVVSPVFLAVAIVAVAAVHLLRDRVPRERVLLFFSVVFVVIGLDPVSLGGLALFVAVGFGLLQVVGRYRWGSVPAVAVTILLFWLLSENDVALARLPVPVVLLGLSFVMFRVVHLLVDVADGELPDRISLQSYLGYLLFFPNFLSGPIQRFEHFSAQFEAPAPALTPDVMRAALRRILYGGFAVIVVSGLAFSIFEECRRYAAGGGVAGGAAFGAASLAFVVHLYASFAGYMGVVIGLGKLVGLEIPENFDRPYAARNFLDIWSRWHITLSDWFRFYVFNPATKELLRVADSARLAPWIGALGFFLTFFVMGLWHGTNATFAVYGLLLGLGVSFNKAWQVMMTQRLGRKRYALLCDTAWYRSAARILALAYFTLALVLIWADLEDVAAATRALGTAGVLAAVATVVAVFAAGAALAAVPVAAWWPDSIRVLIAVAQVCAIAYYLAVWRGTVPTLIYQWF